MRFISIYLKPNYLIISWSIPNGLENLIPVNFKDWVIIDEVQRVPEILNEVHRLIEKSGFKFILTGSSARKLKRAGPNLLAGRALTYSLHPLTAIELDEDPPPGPPGFTGRSRRSSI